MKKLRINRIQYRNQGTTDPTKRGNIEHHVIFKFDTEKEAITFKDNVKNFYYAEEEIPETNSEPEKCLQKESKKKGRPKKNL